VQPCAKHAAIAATSRHLLVAPGVVARRGLVTAWGRLFVVMPPLSARTEQLLARIADQAARARLERLFEQDAALVGPPTPAELERVRFAAIRLALEGARGLAVAEALWAVDVRDLLVNADFADDARAHLHWCEALLAGAAARD